MSGTLFLTVSATGTVDSGPLTLFELGVCVQLADMDVPCLADGGYGAEESEAEP